MSNEPTDTQQAFREWWEKRMLRNRVTVFNRDEVESIAFAAYCAGVRAGQKPPFQTNWQDKLRSPHDPNQNEGS